MVGTQTLLFEEIYWTYLSPLCTTAHSVKTLRHFLHELLLCTTNIVILAYDKTKFQCVKFDQNRCHQTLLVGWKQFCYVFADRKKSVSQQILNIYFVNCGFVFNQWTTGIPDQQHQTISYHKDDSIHISGYAAGIPNRSLRTLELFLLKV